MPVAADESDDDWNPVPGHEEPADLIEFETLDFLDELANPMRARVMRQLKDPKTIADVAEALAVPVTRLYHHVNRLEAAGLIRVVATRKVTAVIERRYQVVARNIGAASKFYESHDPAQVATALGSIFDMAKLGLQHGVESGVLRFDQKEDSMVLSFGHITLTPERGEELMRRLTELVAEFESDASGTDPDATRLAMLIAAYPESI